jgi:hypothetical protein
MATDLSGQSTTASSNSSVGGITISEGCAPSSINDGMRAMIAQSKGALLAVTSAGTNTITATYAPVPDAYVSGWLYPFKAGGTNTGATTFNANSLGAKDVKKMAGTAAAAMTGGEIVSGGFYVLYYDGTDMILLSPPRAAQTQMEAATTDGSAVTPLSVKWHPGVAKAWAEWGASGAITGNPYNVSSITDTGVGNQTANLSVTFSSADNYVCMVTAGVVGFIYASTKAPGGTTIGGRNAADSAAADVHPISAVWFGDI